MKSRLAIVLLLVAAVALGYVIRRDSSPPEGPPPRLQVRSATLSAFSPEIRVNLTSAPVERIRLAVDGPFHVSPVGDLRILGRGQSLAPAEVRALDSGIRIGSHDYAATRLEIVPTASPTIEVDGHRYRGRVRLFRRSGGRLIAVNVLPLEEYIAGVVDSEMPAAFPSAARQAQAVVARTYALVQMTRTPRHPRFDLYATVRSQRYLGTEYRAADGRRLAGETPAGRRAARETAGMICTYRGRPFCTYYAAVCGGRSTPGDRLFADAAPPLQRSVACDWCREAPKYRWQTTLSREEASRRLGEHFAAEGRFGTLTSLTRVPGSPDGPAAGFNADDGSRSYTLTARDLRRLLPSETLPSFRFRARVTGGRVIFDGAGHGHGVGLCQWGARGLAKDGCDCLRILAYYYPGADVVVVTPDGR